MKFSNFKEIPIWKISVNLCSAIYDLTNKKKKFYRDYGLKDQIRRSIVSVSSNIAEGFERNNNNEFVRFLRIAKGSVGEARNQLHISKTLGYISQDEYVTIDEQLESLANQIGGLISYLLNCRRYRQFRSK